MSWLRRRCIPSKPHIYKRGQLWVVRCPNKNWRVLVYKAKTFSSACQYARLWENDE